MPLPTTHWPKTFSSPTREDAPALSGTLAEPNAQTLRTLNRFAIDLMAIPDPETLFWHVAQNVVGQLNFVDCVIYRTDPDGTQLRQVAAWGDKSPTGRSIVNPLVIPFGRGITGHVAQTQRAVIIDDLLHAQAYIPDTQVARSEICVPLVVEGCVVGVIDSEHPEPRAFGPGHLEILSTIAAMTAAKLALLAEAQRSATRYGNLVASHAQLTQEIATRKALESKLVEARKLEALGRLTGRFAHEFNNLLTVILGNIELASVALESGEPGSDTVPETVSETGEYLAAARDAGQRGARLMRDMLAFAQRTRLVPVPVDLAAALTALAESRLVQGLCPLTLVHAGPDGPWRVVIDRAALEDILVNLVENACAAQEAAGRTVPLVITTANHVLGDGGKLPAAFAGIELPPGRYVRLSLRDQGIGIAADRLPQIFDPFYTSRPLAGGSRGGTGGTGLGLSIVRGFVQQSRGAVAVESEPGRGSCFHVLLPAQGEGQAAPAKDQPPA